MSKIIGAFVIRSTVTNISPVVIGTGKQGGDVDIEIARGYAREKGEQPYIPATALMGVLRHRIAGEVSNSSPLRYFWGGDKDSDCQSHFVIEDLILQEGSTPTVAVRDGIKIDDNTGQVESGAKFTCEVLEPGAKFRFHAEALLRDGFDETLFLEQIGRVIHELGHGALAVGAMTAKGFGRIRLEAGIQTWRFDFKQPDHALYWLEYRGGGLPPGKLITTIPPKVGPDSGEFSISADFGIKSSLIIGSYATDPQMPDKTHLSCKGKQIISGTSLKGAMRARAVRIINTFGKDGQKLLKEVFGWADNGKNTGTKPIRSRLIVEEAEIFNAVPEVQNRVKIDRFTGGALESALYDSMPLWETTSGSSVRLNFRLEGFKNWEAGLLLHLLKDLWSGDLPIGGEKNVGRGVLKGKRAIIHVYGKDHVIAAGPDGALSFSEKARQALDIYANAFVKKMEEGNNG